MRKLLFTLLFYFTLIGCYAQYCTADNRFTEAEYFSLAELDSLKNQIYAQALDFQGNQVDLLLDLYFPNNQTDPLSERPTVVLMHGGGFVSGSKEQRRFECLALAQRGYVAATISYRLG